LGTFHKEEVLTFPSIHTLVLREYGSLTIWAHILRRRNHHIDDIVQMILKRFVGSRFRLELKTNGNDRNYSGLIETFIIPIAGVPRLERVPDSREMDWFWEGEVFVSEHSKVFLR
jgi:hypothetical protein